MAMNTIQFNINTQPQPSVKEKKVVKPYLSAQGAVTTENRVHPLPPQGHLIHDNFSNSVKYFFKDIGYDLKSIKNGFNGTANDHQLGRLNDVGLTTAGILIATYLASKTTNPKARIMEYVGLGAFLTAMSVYPKIAINAPAKLMHGYDIDKQYIDDQGRKKSVMQDSNYVPYDMYLGEVPDEDLAIIGDEMGIPRDIVNRNDVIKEQMRKIATQNNTLWMLTAGVTPALAALLCCGLENYVVAPAIEKANIAKYDSAIANALKKTTTMSSDISSISSNSLSNRVESLLSSYKGQELPKDEFENLVKLLSEDLFENTGEGIKEDLARILNTSAHNGVESAIVDENAIKQMIRAAEDSVTKANKESLQKILVPTEEEFVSIIKRFLPADADLAKGTTISVEKIADLKQALKEFIDSKAGAVSGIPQEFLASQRNDIIENITKTLKAEKSHFVSDESIRQITDFAKVLGEFKENQKILQKCKEFNVEFTNDTLIARSYGRFEKTLLDELGIKYSDLKKMRESEKYTKEILDKKFAEICKDEARYKKAMEKLGNVISDMEVKLHGKDESKSRILDLINATENNYNKTAQRLSKLGSFSTTIDRMVKQDVETLGNTITSRQGVFDFLDGVVENANKALFENGKYFGDLTEEQRLNYIRSNANGVGSSKNLEISRLLERYQGAKNSYNRILHTFDVYKRSLTPEKFAEALNGKDPEYVEAIIKKAKDSLLHASAPDHTMKLDLVNNPSFYKDLMNSVWAGEAGEFYSTKQKGLLTSTTKEALGKNNTIAKGNILDRFQYYITRFRNIIGNSDVDFTKPHHILNGDVRKCYTQAERTRMAFFNLVGQTPVDMARGAAGRRFATQKWVRIISAITGGIFGIALASQFGFGKLNNPQNLKKQVNNDSIN